MKLDLSKVKKVSGDKESSTFQHPDGHSFKIAHKGVSALQRKQIEKMPIAKMAEGGEPTPMPQAGPSIPEQEKDNSKPQYPYGAPEGSEDNQQPKSQDQAMLDRPNVEQEQQPVQASQQPQSMAQNAYDSSQLTNSAYNLGLQGIGEQGANSANLSQKNAEVIQKDLADREQFNKTSQAALDALTQQRQHLMSDYAADHINPSHYLENMGAGQKIATGIGLLLGGFSTPFTGQGNPAMDMLQKQIDRDINAQISRKDQQKTLIGANEAALHDHIMAVNQTRVNMNDIMAHKIELEAAKIGTPQAIATAKIASSKFALDNAGLIQSNAMRAAALNGASNGMDPSKLVPILVPKEHQAKAFGEIEAAEDTKRMAGSIMKSFDEAAKDNTVMKTGGGFLRTPPSVYSLHQAMQPTFKDLEGTVRQAAMDNTFKNITPMPGDVDSTISTKRKALEDYLKSKLSAPTARGYGIDLSRYNSTAPMQSQNPNEGKIAVNSSGDKLILKGGKWIPYGK